MKVLVACEFSGIVRDAFKWAGHHAVSCDLLPTERPGHHVQGDVRDLLKQPWDLVIAFPPCTYLSKAGVIWLHRPEKHPDRWDRLRESAEFFLECLNADAPLVAVENPTMHRYAIELVGRKPDFAIQPWEFGHEKVKRTCFWTRGLPPLLPTQIMQKREYWVNKVSDHKGDGWKIRSITFPGVARAMAQQWGALE